jgi:hypothetical protein
MDKSRSIQKVIQSPFIGKIGRSFTLFAAILVLFPPVVVGQEITDSTNYQLLNEVVIPTSCIYTVGA